MMPPLHSMTDISSTRYSTRFFRQSSRDTFAFQAGVPGNTRGKVG
jgi:hypothetical protein